MSITPDDMHPHIKLGSRKSRPRVPRAQIYIDRDPNDFYKGWGWLEINVEDCQKFNIPTGYPETYKKSWHKPERWTISGGGNLPSRGKAGTKKFVVNINGELIEIRAQKSLTVQAVYAWFRTWAPPNAILITPGKRAHSLDGDKISHQVYFIYFILNEDSQAIKIGLAKDLTKRLKALQTSSPAVLKLMKALQVNGAKEARDLEQSLHRQFADIRLTGEWFRAEAALLNYIQQIL